LTHTNPNISFAIGLVAWYMKTPHEIHWKVAKRTLWYNWGTFQFRIHYNSGGTHLLVGFTNLDWVDDPNYRKSIACYVFFLGLQNVTWAYNKQQAIAISSTESEY
jgi:hypothetical protein